MPNVESAFEALRQKADVRLVYLSADEAAAAGEHPYRVTLHYWTGEGPQHTLRVTGDSLLDVLVKAEAAWESRAIYEAHAEAR